MKKTRKGRVFVTASTIRRSITVLLVLLICTTSTVLILFRIRKDRVGQQVLDSSKTLDSTNKQIRENEDQEDNKITLFNDVEEEITWQQEYSSPSSQEPTSNVAVVTIAPGPSYIGGDIQYDGEKHVISTHGQAQNGTMMFYVSESLKTPDKSLFEAYDELLNPDVLSKTGCGKYYVWYYAKGDIGYTDSEIDKAGPFTIVGDDCLLVGQPETETPYIYNGEEQLILKQSSKPSATGGVVKYAFGDDFVVAPDISDFTYEFEDVKKKDVGTYYVWYFVDGDESHNNTDFIPLNTPISLEKLNAYCGVEPQGKSDLLFTGEEQYLVTGARDVMPGCEVKFAVSDTRAAAAYSSELPKASEPGNYTIWWYVDGGTNYNSTEPKCVLSTITDINLPKAIITDVPKPISGQSQKNPLRDLQLIIAGTSNVGTIKYSFGTELTPNDDWTTNALDIKVSQAGDYYIWYYADGTVNGQKLYQDSEKAFVKVKVFASQAIINRPPAPKLGIVADGSSKVLIDEGSASTGLFKYCVKTNDEEPKSNEYLAPLPTGTDPGLYHVWYYAEGTETVGASDPSCVDVLIGRGKIPYTKAPKAKNQTYTGSPLPIVDTNGITSGTWMYAVNHSNQQPDTLAFSSTVPTETEVGTYYVWYYLKGANLYSDSDISYFTVEISKATSSVTQAPTPIINEYTGYGQTIANDGQASTGATMMYHVSSTLVDDIASYSSVFKTTIDRKTEPGTYYVYYYAKGNESINDSEIEHIETRINGSALVTPPQSVNGSLSSTVTFIELLDTNKGLINPPATGTMYYSITNDAMQPALNTFTPMDSYKATKAGTYYIWYFAKIDGADDTAVSYTMSIVKNAARISSHPLLVGQYSSSNSVSLTSSSMNIVIPGSSQDGTLMYYLYETSELSSQPEQDKTLYSKDIPTVNHAGLYELFYYVKGENYYSDSEFLRIDGLIKVTEKASFEQYTKLKPEIETNTFKFEDGSDYTTPMQVIGTQAIAKQPTSADISNDNTVYYILVSEEEVASSSFVVNSSNPKATTNPEEITVMAPGYYYLYSFIEPDTEKTIYEPSEKDLIRFTIKKSKAKVIDHPVSLNTVDYTGGIVEVLDTYGTCNSGCTMKYAVTRTNAEPSDDQYKEASQTAPYYPSGIDTGTYYIWYKAFGNSSYDDSDAQYVTCEVVGTTVNLPSITKDPESNTNLTYDGFSHALIIPGEAENGEMRYYLSTVNVGPGNDNLYSPLPPSAIDGGTYYIFYKVFGEEGNNTSAYCVQTTIARKDQTILSAPIPHESWLRGETHELIIQDATSTGGTQTEYYISDSDELPPDDVQWVGINGTKRSEEGVYYVWYRCKETNNYNATQPDYVTVIIKKPGVVEEEPQKKSEIIADNSNGDYFEYTAGPIVPVTAGSSSTGDMVYAIVSGNKYGSTPPEDSEYTLEIPSRTEIGEYWLYYKSRSKDALYNDSYERSIFFRIDKRKLKILTSPSIEGAITGIYSHKPEPNLEYLLPLYTLEFQGNSLTFVEGSCENGGTVHYMFGKDPERTFIPGNFEEIESNTITGLTAGRYYLGYYIEIEDTNHYSTNYGQSAAYRENLIAIDLVPKIPTLISGPEGTINIDYDGTFKPLITEEPVYDTGVSSLYAVTEDNNPITPKTNPSLFSSSVPERASQGTYYVWYCGADSVDLYNGGEVYCVEVIIGNGINDAVIQTVEQFSPSNPHQQLLVDFVDTNYTYKFIVDSVPHYNVNELTSVFDINDQEPLKPYGTYPGDYYISYSKCVSNPSDMIVSQLHVRIPYPDSPGIDEVPEIRSEQITYDPNNKDLFVNNPSTPGYVYRYAVSAYNTTSPEKSAYYYTEPPKYTDAGTYHIWWYAEGDSTTFYEPTEPVCISKTVEKADAYFDVEPKGIVSDYTGEMIPIFTQPWSESNPDGWKIHGVPSDWTINNNSSGELKFYYVVREKEISIPGKNEFYPNNYISSAYNPGEYVIYYYLGGSNNYNESSIKSVVSKINEPPAEAYIGMEPQLFTTPLQYTGNYQFLLSSTGYGSAGADLIMTIGEKGVTPPLSSFKSSEEKPTGLYAGKYYIYWCVVGHYDRQIKGDIHVIEVEINKSSSVPEAPVFRSVEYAGKTVSFIDTLPSNLDGRQFSYYVEPASVLANDPEHDPSKSLFSTSGYTASEIGDYTIWYYTKETSNYLESEIRHSSVSIVRPTSLAKPQATLFTYDGESHPLIENVVVSAGTYKFALATGDGIPTNFSDTIPQATEAGTYRVYFQLTLKNGIVYDPEFVDSTIKQIPTVIDEAVGATNPVYYTGNQVSLVSSCASSDDGIIAYYVTEDTLSKDDQLAYFSDESHIADMYYGDAYDKFANIFATYLSGDEYNNALSTVSFACISPSAINEGTYNIYYAAIPDTFWKHYHTSEQGQVPGNKTFMNEDAIYSIEGISIEKSICEVTQAPIAIEDLKYEDYNPNPEDRNPITLVEQGTCTDNGTMKYYVSPVQLAEDQINKTMFTTEIPVARNVGTYYVYYFGCGGGISVDSDMCPLTDGNPIEVTITGTNAPIVIAPTLKDKYEYIGTPQDVLVNGADISWSGKTVTNIWYLVLDPYTLPNDAPDQKTATPQVEGVGKYCLWYYAVFSDGSSTYPECIPFEVLKVTPEFTTDPAVINENVEFEVGVSDPTILFTQGVASVGTVKYCMTVDDEQTPDITSFDVWNDSTMAVSPESESVYRLWYFIEESDNVYGTEILGPVTVNVTVIYPMPTSVPAPTEGTAIIEEGKYVLFEDVNRPGWEYRYAIFSVDAYDETQGLSESTFSVNNRMYDRDDFIIVWVMLVNTKTNEIYYWYETTQTFSTTPFTGVHINDNNRMYDGFMFQGGILSSLF